MKSIELLAPAGSKSALIAAVQSGANAVYMGGTNFSARQSAENFGDEAMQEWIDYCHLRNVKVYVAVNTLVKENELDELAEYAHKLSDMGVDAIIIQDMGAIKLFRKLVPDLPLHASTQITVHNLDGVNYFEKLGFERVVLSRELSKENIEYICKNTDCEIEVFVHGALCICYSGQCLMSSIIGGRSGNRGRCAQPCRLAYELIDEQGAVKKGHLLSTKDLSLIDDVRHMDSIGVKSLKIEGRLKRAEYVATISGIYSKYLHSDKKITDADRKILKDAFNRSGLTRAYYGGDTGAKMMSIATPGNMSENIFSDEIKKRCADNANFVKFGVDITATVKKGEPFMLEMTDCDGNYAYASGEVLAQTAQNRALDKERIAQQLKKLGNTVFKANTIVADVEDGISLPISEINNVRRKAVEELERLRTEKPVRRKLPYEGLKKVERNAENIDLTVEVYTMEQAETALKYGVKRIYAPKHIAEKIRPNVDTEIVAKAYEIEKDDMQKFNTSCDSILVSMPWQRKDNNKKWYADFRFNVFNSICADAYGDFECVTISPELNLKEIANVTKHTSANIEVIAYGRLPLMITQNCPVKVSGKCQHEKMKYSLKDRMNENFPIVCGHGCVAKILNSKPIFMADKVEDLKKLKINSIRLIFTVENSMECDKIINMYKCALAGEKGNFKMKENTFTRGHFYRGVE